MGAVRKREKTERELDQRQRRSRGEKGNWFAVVWLEVEEKKQSSLEPS